MKNNEQNQKYSIIRIHVAAAQHNMRTNTKIINENQCLKTIMRRVNDNDAAH